MVTLRIGSRPSPLALAQAQLVRGRLAQLMPWEKVEIVPIRTSGDRLASASLAQVGGKGLFIKELEQALIERRIDLAVHSMKDLPAALTPGLCIAAVPPRADPRDALLIRAAARVPAQRTPRAQSGGAGDEDAAASAAFARLAPGARVGTSSTRRRFAALRIRADLEIGALRGNIDTRLKRLVAGDFDAIILARAGLTRLEYAQPFGVRLLSLDERDFVPAGGQGALAVETLADAPLGGSLELGAALSALEHAHTRLEISAERGFLAALGASCVSPVGVRAKFSEGTLDVRAILFSIDGARHLADELSEEVPPLGPPERAADAGARLAQRILAGGGRELLAHG